MLWADTPLTAAVVSIVIESPRLTFFVASIHPSFHPLVCASPCRGRQSTGTREHIQYDRRREMSDFVEFLNEECGTSVEIPANFKPKASRAQAAERAADPVLQFALKFNDYISKFKFEEGMKFGTDGLDE